MNKEKLFGIKPNFLTVAYSNFIKSAIFLRYSINPEQKILLGSKPSPILKDLEIFQKGNGVKVENGILVGTVRMGYGHHRMAYALYSWVLAKKVKPYLHDLLGIESNEAVAIKEIDGLYSQMSRLSSEWGGIVEWAWGQITAQGNIGSLYVSTILAESYTNMMSDLPRSMPYISTYPLNGQIAVEAGFKNVIHLIPDNFPQYYLLVPGAMNLVQSPASYHKFIDMGVPKENLQIAGHWVSEPIVTNVEADSKARLERIEKQKPKRLLLAIGGAGAQKNYTINFIEKIKNKLKNGELHLFINAGDHGTLFDTLKEEFEKMGLHYNIVSNWNDLLEFCKTNTIDSTTESKLAPITIFHYTTYFEAFTTTDYLIRVSDILVTKPSELAFYPIPKLFIRRVGDHEAASAFRSMELGEGTTECREPEHAFEMVKLLTEQSSILQRMNECVIRNAKDGIYDGAKNAVEMAMKSL
ncbi:MAG TPA: hypothetical protein PK079_10585 [Leptospiraceae bacterium]|nr:hypothetical protein [Leptospiraceae bacterium]HMX32698.1 hypothetical protein [Leptospiraceae bacterium]HMY32714.1 hypothetical protein [Leptospiraceae bacterium]HMZ62522.1 hypothetical protein [Leptospiraceae bacterium]HNA05754.1 hypothetical protein [Leptospiraceae bacterium]